MKVRKNTLLYVSALCATFLSACGQSKTQQQTEALCGSDKDERGCIGTAGYIWSEVQQNCIRLFESGIRLESADGKTSAFLVFSPDSSKVELFFSNDNPSEILDRHTLPSGQYAWNVENDDTKNILSSNGQWTISQRGKIIYMQEKEKDESSIDKK